ncbi:MAG: BtpA/SgcQ family protein [Chloroflexota bacterium]|nr:BtpA/SgcQ family protein [Chloroflexota bacterium]
MVVTERDAAEAATSRPRLFHAGAGTLVAMLHLQPLPGSPLHDGTPLQAIERRTLDEARALAEAGFDALMLQNTGDGPPGKDADFATVAQMAAVGHAVAREIPLPIGVNVLKNGVETAFAVAAAIGARFVRIKVYVGAAVGSEGLVEAGARAALAERRRLGLQHVAILADVLDRTSRSLVELPVTEAADWAVRHGHADALVITGRDVDETLGMLTDLRAAGADVPLVVGGGGSPDNAAELLKMADGLIVGAALRDAAESGAPVSVERARRFVQAARPRAVASP